VKIAETQKLATNASMDLNLISLLVFANMKKKQPKTSLAKRRTARNAF
jgi:hypothetical protein